jgi:hypothetical protein
MISCNNDERDHDGSKGDTINTNVSPAPQDTAAQHNMPLPASDAKLEVKTIKTDLGWGYDVYMNGSMYVHQPHMPAVSGNKGFKSEEDAKRTAELVIYKIKNNIIPPSLTVSELDSLGVTK